MDKKLEKLFDQYEGNLLNYFCGLTPKQSKQFNKITMFTSTLLLETLKLRQKKKHKLKL